MRPLSATWRVSLALLWLAVLVAIGVWQSRHLQMSGDLRKFMPSAETPAQKFLMDELGEGPGSRLLLMSVEGAPADALAAQSRLMQVKLAGNPDFVLVSNGGMSDLDAIPARLRSYRYLLSNSGVHLDRDALSSALQERLADLGSPAAAMIEPLLGADPTLETLALAQQWQPANGPQTIDGVWFDAAGKKSLLLAQTRAAGFDPTGQERAVAAIRTAFEASRREVPAASGAKLTLTGPGAFAVEIGGRTSKEASMIGTIDGIALFILLILAYRSWRTPIFGALPLATAGVAGLAAVALCFDGVHGITVAFGFTLIGVVQDYPIHLLSHQRAGISPWDNARKIWPTLATGVASTCIAYFTFLASGVDGLKQLAVFTVVGLVSAALTTRCLLPALIDPAPRDPADSRALSRLWFQVERIPRAPKWVLAGIAAASLAVIVLSPAGFWENDLSKLTPVPTAALKQDEQLRSALGAPDVRYVIALQANTADAALRRAEQLQPQLDALVADGAIQNYDMAARYLPSAEKQRTRQAALPDPATLRQALDAALVDTDFRADVFGDFLRDVETARTAPPLRFNDLKGTPLESSLGGLLLQREGHATALVSLSGIRNASEVQKVLSAEGVQLLDLKAASESLVVAYRQRVLWSLLVASVLLVVTVWFALKQRHRVVRVLLPMSLSLLLILAVLRGLGIELNLFHLVAFILAAGLGLDYALFFEHAGDDRPDQLRTFHALIVCSLTTVLVFFLLALSSIPVLRAIGLTVTLGVIFNFVLALWIARAPTRA